MKKLFTLSVIAMLATTFAYAAGDIPRVKTYIATDLIIGDTVLSPDGGSGESAISSYFITTNSDMKISAQWSTNNTYIVSLDNGPAQYFEMDSSDSTETTVISIADIGNNFDSRQNYNGVGKVTLYLKPKVVRTGSEYEGGYQYYYRAFDLEPHSFETKTGIVGITETPWKTLTAADYDERPLWKIELEKAPGSPFWTLIKYTKFTMAELMPGY